MLGWEEYISVLVSAVIFSLLGCYGIVVVAVVAVSCCVDSSLVRLGRGSCPKDSAVGLQPSREMQKDAGARGDGPDSKPQVPAQPMPGSVYALPSLQDLSYLFHFINYLFSFLGLFGVFLSLNVGDIFILKKMPIFFLYQSDFIVV